MEADEKPEQKPTEKVEKLSQVKVESKPGKAVEDKPETVNMINAVSDLFGLAIFEVREMLLTGTITIDGKEWSPKNGDFTIPLDDIQGKEVEIKASPKSVKFNFRSEELNEYRTSPPE